MKFQNNIRKNPRPLLQIILLMVALVSIVSTPAIASNATEFPEIEEINALIARESAPEGVVFTVMEDQEDALEWVLVRLKHYTSQLRQRFPNLEIAVVSHGDEILSLPEQQREQYPEIHQALVKILREFDISFHICESFASMNDLDASEFPDYVDVVPFGPSKIQDYKQVGFEMISLELTW